MLGFSSDQPLRWRTIFLSLCLSASLAGCAGNTSKQRSPDWNSGIDRTQSKAPSLPLEIGEPIPFETPIEETREPEDAAFYKPGNGRFVSPPRSSIAQARVQKEGDIKLNFQNANLLEVIKVILGDMLGATYIVDPNVQGSVSMQTAGALRREDLIPTLEMLLRMNDAAVVTDQGIYRVMPLAFALTGVRAPQLGDATLSLPPGYSVRVVPLKYVAAEEMAQILEPFVTDTNQLVRVDTARNLLVLAANGGDMDRLLETIHVFDVDRMRGMSVAMFTPDFVDAKTLGEELDNLLGNPDTGLMAGLVRFMVVDRLNGLMVVTPRAEYLAQVKEWISRLDRDNGSVGRRLFIYRVQNGKAKDLAAILTQLFTENGGSDIPQAELAPGLEPFTLGETADEQTDEGITETPFTPSGGSDIALTENTDVRVIADEANNALLIRANSIEYRQIRSALQQLDISPMQVLVEVTIAEVTLTDNLQYGVEWFFNNKVGGSLTGVGTLDLGTSGIAGITPGFSYALQGTGGAVNAVINLLATESNLSIVSSPTLLVLNNQEASIQVGDEVPVSTQQQQASDANSNIINSIEYRDTGVQLKVKPRINAGGLVIMEVEQETSQVPTGNNADPLTPRIQTRKITSTVAVNSGDTIILGGLIEDNKGVSESGIPELHEVPVLGNLFGNTSENKDRTELLVLITPRAITHRNSALQVTEEFRRKLNSLIPVQTRATRPFMMPPSAAPEAAPASEPVSEAVPEPIQAPSRPVTQPAQTSTPEVKQPVAEKIPTVQESAVMPALTTEKAAPPPPVITAAAAPPPPAAVRLCERIGPFENEPTDLPTQSADKAEIVFTENEVQIGHQVLVQAPEGQAEAVLKQLRTEGYQQALLYTAGRTSNKISLGVFSNPQNAQRLADKVAGATAQPLYRSRKQYWLDIEHSNNGGISAWFNRQTEAGLARQPRDCV